MLHTKGMNLPGITWFFWDQIVDYNMPMVVYQKLHQVPLYLQSMIVHPVLKYALDFRDRTKSD